MQPDVSTQELISSINELANNTGNTKEAVSEQIYKELKADEEQGKKKQVKMNTLGASGGTVSVGNSNMGISSIRVHTLHT